MNKEERMQALKVNLINWNFDVDAHFDMTQEDADIILELIEQREERNETN